MGPKMQAKMEQAIAYILAHPDASKADAVRDTGLSESSIARARKYLISKDLISTSRRGKPIIPPPSHPDMMGRPAGPVPSADTEEVPGSPGLLDHAAMLAMAGVTGLPEEELSEEEVQKRLMRQAQTFAFNPNLHPDTRMSASTLWAKLRELRREATLGPGAPTTFADAVARTKEVLLAVGRVVAAVAVQEAFYAGQEADEQAAAPGGAAEAAGEAGHAGDPEAPADLRAEHLGVRADGEDEGLEHPDLPRPPA